MITGYYFMVEVYLQHHTAVIGIETVLFIVNTHCCEFSSHAQKIFHSYSSVDLE